MSYLSFVPVTLPLLLAPPQMEIQYKKKTLDNGLQVLVHEDHSDPLVSVFLYYHVGSGREAPGRTGFAHLFEHMMFQGSQHVGDDQHFKLIQQAGGTLNGTTNTDRTNYYETLPANQLELALWLEADRMGFLLPAMTQEKLDNQREVVKNERRQSYENRPYGLEGETIVRALFPADHPYSWTTIGSMEDLGAATMEDVQGFFRRWYGPNNATLAVGGDVDSEQVFALVERWFGSLPSGPPVAKPTPRPVRLEHTKRLVLEDRVKLPQVSYTWPTVEAGHADEAALDMLGDVLSANKSAVLDKALTIDEQLASLVTVGHETREMAGFVTITLRPQPEVTLDVLEQRLHALLAQVAEQGVEDERLQRLKNRWEASAIRRIETVSARTSRLAQDNVFYGEPDRVQWDLDRHLAVTAADVVRVLRAYVLDRPAVIVSVVPEGRSDLAASGRDPAQVQGEQALDRRAQPAPAGAIAFRQPAVWHGKLANGVPVVGTRYDDVPLARLRLSVPAGRLYEPVEAAGLASLTAAMLEEGTQRLASTELQDAFDGLGATFSVGSSDTEISFELSVLDKHLAAAVGLLGEVVLQPRFADEDFERVQRDRLTALATRDDDARAVAQDVWDALLYGDSTAAGRPDLGTTESVARLTAEDVRRFWRRHSTPERARLVFTGALEAPGVADLLGGLARSWRAPSEKLPERPTPVARFTERTTIHLVHKPGAAQSEIRIGHPGVSSLDPDYYPLSILNYPLGGSFSSRINMNLREDKGYTYGARSSFAGGAFTAPFVASAAVRSDVTSASVRELVQEITGIRPGVTDEELAFTRSALTDAMSRQFESTRALLSMLDEISEYGYPDDYLARRCKTVAAITRDELAGLAKEYVHPERLAILVVGDRDALEAPAAEGAAATSVLAGLQALGFGEVVELDARGRRVPGS